MEKKQRKAVSEILLPDMLDGDGDIIPIIADGDDGELDDVDVPEIIPVLSLRNTVLFPGVVLPISIGIPYLYASVSKSLYIGFTVYKPIKFSLKCFFKHRSTG